MKKQNHTSQKGITLIALIITIIVMLILVGVTINVALNGGLFQKAEIATRETEEKAILEEMLAMMEIDNNGKFKPGEIISNMKLRHPEYTITDEYPNVTIKGNLGTYNYIVSETEIKIGSKEIEPFKWEDVGLIVDIDKDYRFYDTRFSTTYLINFTVDGKLIVKADGMVVETYDATEEDDGILTIPFTYAGTTYDTTLKMNTNNIDVDAELKDFTTVTYIKVEEKTYPVAYVNPNYGRATLIEISPTEMIVYDKLDGYEVTAKYTIYLCTDIFKLDKGVIYNRIENDTGLEINYSKVLLDEMGSFAEFVYDENLDKWMKLGQTRTEGNEHYHYTTAWFFDKTNLPQEEIDRIIELANRAN